MQTIHEKVNELLALRHQIDEMKQALTPLQAQRDVLQRNVIEHMVKDGFNSIKTDQASVARITSKRLTITDEKTLVKDLKKRGLGDYVMERVAGDIWQPFARQAVKENLKLKGTEIVETEYISIRQNKKEGGEKNE